MKIYTASYFEPEVHGDGRKIGISPSKPNNLDYNCDSCHEWLSPEDVYWDYHKSKRAADGNKELLKKAGQEFINSYKDRLQAFREKLDSDAAETGKSVQELIGLE